MNTFIAILGIIILAILILVSIASATQDSDTWYNKGVVLSQLNKSGEAIKACDKAIEIDPQNLMAWQVKDLLYII